MIKLQKISLVVNRSLVKIKNSWMRLSARSRRTVISTAKKLTLRRKKQKEVLFQTQKKRRPKKGKRLKIM